MLSELHVRDLALIEEAWLEFDQGLTVLTGETGAGKTALIGAVKLLVGERADSSLVRSGASEAVVEGRIETPDGEMVARRRLSADGRSRCTLDGEMATVGELAERLGSLFDLHGQHDHQALLRPARHVFYLDRFIGAKATEALDAYRTAKAECSAAVLRLRELEDELREAEERADHLRFVLEDIDKVDPRPGEDREMEARLPALRHGERLALAAAEAHSALKDDEGAIDRTAVALSALDSVAGLDPALDEMRASLAEASILLDELGTEIRRYGESIEHDPAALDMAQARLAALADLKKKYGPELEDVLKTREESEERLLSLEAGDEELARVRAEAEKARERLEHSAAELTTVRTEAVPAFTGSLARAVEDLSLSGARFEVSIEELPFEEWTADGPHVVEFLFSSALDQPTRPLAKIASGGEISRVMLALKSVLGSADDVPVLIFDEVDAGIGGNAAIAVGRRLSELASDHQVLVVTHLAQVAAFADRHLVVEKETSDGVTRTYVRAVEGQERVREIARMLSGAETQTGLAHAEELLETCGKQVC